jgi:hypothetical protein
VIVQEFKQVGDRLQWFGLAAFVAGKCISPSPGELCGLPLRQLKFFTNSCKFRCFSCINFLGNLFDGLGKTNTFARFEFNFPAIETMPSLDLQVYLACNHLFHEVGSKYSQHLSREAGSTYMQFHGHVAD